VNANETEEEVQDEGLACDYDLNFDADNIKFEEGDRVFMVMVHSVNPQDGHHSTSLLHSVKWLSTLYLNVDNGTMPSNYNTNHPLA
jgi:hypothetical protein